MSDLRAHVPEASSDDLDGSRCDDHVVDEQRDRGRGIPALLDDHRDAAPADGNAPIPALDDEVLPGPVVVEDEPVILDEERKT